MESKRDDEGPQHALTAMARGGGSMAVVVVVVEGGNKMYSPWVCGVNRHSRHMVSRLRFAIRATQMSITAGTWFCWPQRDG